MKIILELEVKEGHEDDVMGGLEAVVRSMNDSSYRGFGFKPPILNYIFFEESKYEE